MPVDAVAAAFDEFAWGDSEAQRNDIPLAAWPGWSNPRVDRCPIAFACRLLREIHLDDPTQSLLVAPIQRVWISPAVLTPDPQGLRIDVIALRPPARAGKGHFWRCRATDTAPGREPRPPARSLGRIRTDALAQ